MLDQRRRRWPNIEMTLNRCFLFDWHAQNMSSSQQFDIGVIMANRLQCCPDIAPILDQRLVAAGFVRTVIYWAHQCCYNVGQSSTTLAQHCSNIGSMSRLSRNCISSSHFTFSNQSSLAYLDSYDIKLYSFLLHNHQPHGSPFSN